MLERAEPSVAISPIEGVPSPQTVAIFKQAFKAHPAALLDRGLTCAFLSGFAQRATFLIARDLVTGDELGFAVGGDAAVLDRTRTHFIRTHSWQLARSFLNNPLSARILLARMQVRRPVWAAIDAPYQLRFIAVASHARGARLGTTLLTAFERTLPTGSTYHAWTLEGPRGAEKFYLGNGFTSGTNVNGHIRMWKRLPRL